MNFGSIIGFLVIMVISSLFNKDKNAKRPSAQPSRPEPSGRPNAKEPNAKQSKRKTFTGGLEDLFSELKGELDKTFGDTEKKQSDSNLSHNTMETNNVEVNKNAHKFMSSRLKDNSRQNRDSVYEDEIGKEEIGKEEISIEFDKKSIVQGIIMSEILQKPKSLKR